MNARPRSATFQKTLFAAELQSRMLDRLSAGRQRPAKPIYDSWTEAIHPLVRAEAPAVVSEDGVRKHDYLHAVISSMGFALNLFLPFRLRNPAPLAALLSTELRRQVSVERVVFEYGGPTSVLCEVAGESPTDDDRFTAADVGLFLRDSSGKAGIVLIEVKLSEGGFTNCNGATSRGNRRIDVCDSATRFFSDATSCYLKRPIHAQRDRRYWDIFSHEHGSMREAFPGTAEGACPFRLDNQQIMRNHALLLGLLQEELFQFGGFGLVYHDQNPDVRPMWGAYRSLVRSPDLLFEMPASRVARAAEAALGVSNGWLLNHYFLEDRSWATPIASA